MDNINYISNNLNNINNSLPINKNNDEIRLKFVFTNGTSYYIQSKKNIKLSELINKFKQEKNLNETINAVVSQGMIVDQEKTISELKLKNDQILLFICGVNNDDDNEDNIEVKQSYKLTADEISMLRKWKLEYNEKKLLEKILKEKKILRNIDNNESMENIDKFQNFKEFAKEKEKPSSIDVKEHSHKLVYCISILNWKCSICKNNYQKDDAKYYCSLCNYNMCDNCHSKGEYTKKKIFPKGIKPSNPNIINPIIKSKHHEHNLIYCRSSRSIIGYNTWICDICDKEYKNDIWSFYCTQCDFDLCSICAGFK